MTEIQTAPEPRTKSKDAWKAKKVHRDVVLPSGATVDITLPNIAQMAKTGSIPNGLLRIALKQDPKPGETKPEAEDILKENWEFAEFIVPIMVVEPAGLTVDDVNELPPEDVELLVAFAIRQTDTDAAHRHIGGLETYQSFRDARGIFTSDPDILGVQSSGEAAADVE